MLGFGYTLGLVLGTFLLAAPGLTVFWDPVLVDTNGAAVELSGYEVRIYNHTTNTLVYSNTIGTEVTSVTVDSPAFATGVWRVEVRAIGRNGRVSAPGTVFYTPPVDTSVPAAPIGVRVS